MPGAGVEPARGITPRDFKSLASANSATPANRNVDMSKCRYFEISIFRCLDMSSYEARAGLEPAYKGFADPCLTTWLPGLKGSQTFPSSQTHSLQNKIIFSVKVLLLLILCPLKTEFPALF